MQSLTSTLLVTRLLSLPSSQSICPIVPRFVGPREHHKSLRLQTSVSHQPANTTTPHAHNSSKANTHSAFPTNPTRYQDSQCLPPASCPRIWPSSLPPRGEKSAIPWSLARPLRAVAIPVPRTSSGPLRPLAQTTASSPWTATAAALRLTSPSPQHHQRPVGNGPAGR